MKTNYSSETLLRKTSSIRNFFKFLLFNEYISSIPTQNIEKLKKGKYLPEVLTLKEIKNIIAAIDNSLKGKRDSLILKLLVATGGRISEIINLKIEDLDPEFSNIRVIGKGNKIRIIPIYKELGDEINDYILNTRNKFLKGKESFLLFPNISRQLFWSNLKKYAKNAQISKNIYPHIFRHSIASLMLKNGADLRIVQEILGHSNISTTEIYTHFNKDHLKSLYVKSGIGKKI